MQLLIEMSDYLDCNYLGLMPLLDAAHVVTACLLLLKQHATLCQRTSHLSYLLACGVKKRSGQLQVIIVWFILSKTIIQMVVLLSKEQGSKFMCVSCEAIMQFNSSKNNNLCVFLLHLIILHVGSFGVCPFVNYNPTRLLPS